MAVTKFTRAELEKKFEDRYLNKCIRMSYPGYPSTTGKVDKIAVDHHGVLILQMNEKRYQISLESIKDVIQLL